MAKPSRILAAGVLSALLFGSAAEAMQIPQYDRMDARDEGAFRAFLIRSAYNDLKARGQNDQAEKLLKLFEDKGANGGNKQFDKNLDMVRALNQRNAGDPNYKGQVYEVEHAMALTLKQDGIVVAVSTLLASGQAFKAEYPPQPSH